jgi:hypothetical protein
MRSIVSLMLITLSAIAIRPLPGVAEQQNTCSDVYFEQELQKAKATAATWANLRNHEGSLNYESAALLNDACQNLAKASAPGHSCPPGCSFVGSPKIVFSSVPSKYLQQYSEKERCDEYLSTTTKEPLMFENKRFSNSQSLSEWFSDFSRGKGKDGELLYELCPGKCSPRYRSFIEKQGNGYLLSAHVLCGPARDKDDNNFDLSVTYRWDCEKRAE